MALLEEELARLKNQSRYDLKKHQERNEELKKSHEQMKTQLQLDFANQFNELIQTKKEELEAASDRLAQEKLQVQQSLESKISELHRQHADEKLEINAEFESKMAKRKQEMDELKVSYEKAQEELR